MTKRAGHELDSDRWRSLLAKRLVACPPHQLVPRHPERNPFCFVGAIFGFAGLLALVLGVWQIAMHVKERNLLEQMRLEFEAKRAGWTDAEWIAFRVPCVFRFGSFGEMAHWQGNR